MASGLKISASVLAILIASTSPAAADPITVIIAGASAFSVSAAGVISFSWAAFAGSLALSMVGKLLQKKPKTSTSGTGSPRSSGMTQQVRQPIVARDSVYGEVRKSGAIIYAGTTENNKYLHIFIALASHEIEEIGECIVDDYSITDDMLDVNGNVTAGRYANVMRIRKHLGSVSQSADSLAISEISEWTSAHVGSGIPYVYIRLTWNTNKFPSGIPNFSFWLRGKKLLDTRTSEIKYTANPAFFIRDYLTDIDLGAGVRSEFIDTESFETAANLSEEFVTTGNISANFTAVDTATGIITIDGTTLVFLRGDRVQVTSGTIGGVSAATDYYVIPYQRQGTCRIKLAASYDDSLSGVAVNLTSGTTGTITKNAEPRYQSGGVLLGEQSPAENLEEMLTSVSGFLTYAGGVFNLIAGSYRTPTIYLDESDLAGGITVQTKVSKQDRFNRIQGVYTGQINNGNPSDYPIIKNDTYATEDGEVLLRSYDLAYTQRPHTAQRLAKIQLEDARQEIRFTAKFKLTAFKLQVGDNFYFSFNRHGWDEKVFEVKRWKIAVADGAPVIEIDAKETASTIWDWSSGEETAVDPAPNSNLPSVFDVEPPLNIVFSSRPVTTALGDTFYVLSVQWDASADSFVYTGGTVELQFKLASEVEWRPSFSINGGQNFTDLLQASVNTPYDIRLRYVNIMGVSSEWTVLEDVGIATSGGVGTVDDWGAVTDSVGVSKDWAAVTDSVGATEDWETVI